MRIVCMSDSHNQHRRLPTPVPDGDVFVHAGDFGCTGAEHDVRDFGAWVRSLPHPHKIVIAGNHDVTHATRPDDAHAWIGGGFTYLEETGCVIDNLHFWGSPYHPQTDRWAFGRQRGTELAATWGKIPANVDVLITHGPPAGICDHDITGTGHYGDADLLHALQTRVHPKLHIFGHVHEGAGSVIWPTGTRFVNVCVCGPGNRMQRGCTVVDL